MPTRIAADASPIPGYRLIERLGRGGFGEVWKAEAPGGMLKAIKFVYGDLDEATEDGKPAEQELKSLHRVKSIRHPYILSLERFDIVDGQLLIVMELADRNLFDRFRECQSQGMPGIPRNELLSYMEEAAEALDLMNSQFQLQHLDIKPQNLFLVFNHIKIADFGLAKDLEGMQATLTGGVTPVYASPETFEGKVTRFCDQYSLAIVYQELLTGQRPFPGTTARQLMMQHIHSAPELGALPENDRPVIDRALSKIPERRFANCTDFVCALRNGSNTPAVPVPTATVGARPAISPMNKPSLSPAPAVSVRRAAPTHVAGAAKNAPVLLPSLSDRPRLPSLLTQKQVFQAATAARSTPEERTGPGCLMPALIIGLGEMGAIVMQRLRRSLRDRFGAAALPTMRFLLIDTDAATIQAATSASHAPLEGNEAFFARMNRASHYSKPREDLPNVGAWLQPQLLYRLPRQPATAGIRAFGRLAFCDHYRALMQRIDAELESMLDPEAMERACAATGLELRSTWPRVYIVSSLVGATGGGMFVDLAYAMKRRLRMFGYQQPEVHGVLFVPQVDRSASKNPAVANSFAALQELFHFSSPSSTYEALFDRAEGPTVDRERPFQRTLLLQLPPVSETSATRGALGQGAGYLYQELLTPFGRNADKARATFTKPAGSSSTFHTTGSFRLTWPRRALLDNAARRCCETVLGSWCATDSSHLTEIIRGWLTEQWTRTQLEPGQLSERLLADCQDLMHQSPAQALDTCLASLDTAGTQPIEVGDICAVLDRVIQLVGLPDADGKTGPANTVANMFGHAARKVSAEAEKRMSELTIATIEVPGYRLPAAEEVLRQADVIVRANLDAAETENTRLYHESHGLYSRLMTSISSLEAMSRGSRRIVASREIVECIRSFATRRVQAVTARTVCEIYRALHNAMPEVQRELQYIRRRLEEVRGQITSSIAKAEKQGYLGPCKAVFPQGCQTVDEAAVLWINSLVAADVAELDKRVQDQVGRQFSTLSKFCQDKSNLSRSLGDLIVDTTREFLDQRMGRENVASVLLRGEDRLEIVRRELSAAFQEARPDLSSERLRPEMQLNLLCVPDHEDGVTVAALAERTIADARFSTAKGTDDILFHREQMSISVADLPQLGSAAREAFLHITHQDQTPPHSRHDVTWQPVGSE